MEAYEHIIRVRTTTVLARREAVSTGFLRAQSVYHSIKHRFRASYPAHLAITLYLRQSMKYIKKLGPDRDKSRTFRFLQTSQARQTLARVGTFLHCEKPLQ